MNNNKKKLSLTALILIALALGFIVGFLMQNHADIAMQYIQPFGVIFLNLLKFIVVPLVLLSIICGIIGMTDVSKLGRLGIRSVLYFMLTTVFAVTLGLVFTTLLKDVLPVIEIPIEDEIEEVPQLSLIDQIVDFFPDNMFEPLATANMMQVIIIALFIGFAIVKVGDKAKPAADVLMSFNEIVNKILSFIMSLAPIGVFCMLCPAVAVNGSSILGSYAVLIGVAYLCFVIHAIVVYASCVRVLGKMSPLKFFKEMIPAMLFAYSSDSSLATLPVSMECTSKLGVPKDIGSFVLSLGATINMDGVAIYLGVTSVFIANCCGIDLTMQQYLAIAISATVASIGTPGVPGGSLALMAMVFASAGIPVEGVAIVAGIDRIIDMARTTMSITGDASCAVVMAHFDKNEPTETIQS